MLTTDQIRSIYLEHFKAAGHTEIRSAPLVPATHDPSVLLTTAGMHPLKPYFLGQEQPPSERLTSCQKCFRTTDIENVGITARHLTFFEMLGNFSIGDYFKQGAIEQAWELATNGFGFDPTTVWITVFAGDSELGLGPDEEAIAAWKDVGVSDDRIVALGRKDNFWQAGPTGPCGPCSELYLDRGSEFGPDDERPGDDGERFLEFWNLVFMEFDQLESGDLVPLPSRNIDTGMGLNRMAAILQGVSSVFDTDQFAPLIALGRQLATGEADERSLRILADHSRAMCFLVADGVVPSNEERGYILRRLMRRAILHGRRLGMETGFLSLYADQVESLMGEAYPELIEQRAAIRSWLDGEEEGFSKTLASGTELLDDLIAKARESGSEGISAEDAFRLHDTHGFPIDLTLELVAEQSLGVDEAGFELLMDGQRDRARGGSATGDPLAGAQALRDLHQRFASESPQTEFVGFTELAVETEVVAAEMLENGGQLVKLSSSPFYAAGGGQVSDTGTLDNFEGDRLCAISDVARVGSDQVLSVDGPQLAVGQRVVAKVDRERRLATAANHTATHLLHAALRETLGDHVRQAGSSVAPDKLRFDFTHGEALTDQQIETVENSVNDQILSNFDVSSTETSLDEAKRRGAMALFGEKYGERVRMVEVDDGEWSRELCGGTHVRATAEIGLFKLLSESSSASNVRRIEAVTGPVAVQLLRESDASLRAAAKLLRTTPEHVSSVIVKRDQRLKELESELKDSEAPDPKEISETAVAEGDALLVFRSVEGVDPKSLPDLADQVRGLLGDSAAVVLANTASDRVDLVAAVGKDLIDRGVKAGAIVAAAAGEVGGGGGGRDNMARAGGKDPSRVEQALDAARSVVNLALS